MRIASLFFGQRMSLHSAVRIGIGVVIVFVFAIAEGGYMPLRPLDALEQQAYDARLRLFMPATVDPRIVILDIDEKSLVAEGHWPWGRDKLALMVRQLFDHYHVAAAGFDVAFPERDPSSGIDALDRLSRGDLKEDAEFRAFLERSRATLDFDQVFATELAKHPVVLGFFINYGNKESTGVLPPPNFLEKDLAGATYLTTEATGYNGNRPELQKAVAAGGHLSPGLDPDGVTRRMPVFVRYNHAY